LVYLHAYPGHGARGNASLAGGLFRVSCMLAEAEALSRTAFAYFDMRQAFKLICVKARAMPQRDPDVWPRDVRGRVPARAAFRDGPRD